MGKLTGWSLVLFFLMVVAVPQEVAAQGFLSRLFKKGGISTYVRHKKAAGYKQYYCGDMNAYNKRKAYKKHKKSRSRSILTRRSSGNRGKEPVVQTKTAKKLTSPAQTTITGKKQLKKPVQEPPAHTPPDPPVSFPESAPVAKKLPVTPTKPDAVLVVKKTKPVLTRTALKEMTETERRDTLQQMEPDIELAPIQFISNQDEFSVVNMDSFMKAMEYAKQGKMVLVEGHTDDLGRDSYNLSLSMKRAEKIRELLLSGGISDELISVIGYGETNPLLPNTSNESRAINRRIEFKIFNLSE